MAKISRADCYLPLLPLDQARQGPAVKSSNLHAGWEGAKPPSCTSELLAGGCLLIRLPAQPAMGLRSGN